MKKIPEHAKVVFEGILHDIYHWEQEMFDGTFSTFEAVKHKDTVTILAVVGDKIIINNEEQPNRAPFVAVPGGVAEPDCNILENAQRELLEETGYESTNWEEWFVSDVLNHSKLEWNNHFFIAHDCQKTQEPQLDAGEKIETKLVTLEEFIEIRKEPSFRNKELLPILEATVNNEGKKKELKELLKINNY